MVTSTGASAQEFAPVPRRDNEVTRFLGKLLVHAPRHHGGLTIFPLELRGTEDETDYASLDEGFGQSFIRVSDTGSVNRVTMENLSRHRWVSAIAGEVLRGGKQNRMLRVDVLLPPSSGPVIVPTYCVEQGRWTGREGAGFREGRTLSNYALRQRALAGASQAEVWGQVDAEQRRFGIASPTRDYEAVAQSPAVARELSAYRAAFVRVWRPRTVGFVVAQGRRIVSADVFCNARLFWKLRHKLIDSYAFDCVRRYPGWRGWRGDQQEAINFMARIYTARFDRRSSPGAGEKLAFRGNGVEGRALVHRGAVIHLHASPGYRILRVPPPRPPRPIPPLPQPR